MVFLVFSVRPTFFCSSGVSVCCSGNASSRKEIYHGVNHTQKHVTEVFHRTRTNQKKDLKKQHSVGHVRLLPILHFMSFHARSQPVVGEESRKK